MWTLCIWRTLCRHVTIGTPIVSFAVLTIVPIVKNSQNHWCTNRHSSTKTVPTVYQSSKTVKRQSKQQKMTIGVPIVTCLHRVHRIHKVCVRRPRPPNTQIQNFLKIWSRQYVAKACAKLIMSWITGNEWLVALVNVKNPSENDKTVYLILDLHCVYFSRFCSKLILGCQMW